MLSFYKNSQWSKSALHNKNKNKILNLQNYKTTLSSYKNIIILYNIITNFKKPRLELRFKRRKGITRSKFEWKCIPNRRRRERQDLDRIFLLISRTI